MERFKKTYDLLQELNWKNTTSQYGRPIPDVMWNEVIKELSNANKKIENYKTISIGLVVIIIFISSYLLL